MARNKAALTVLAVSLTVLPTGANAQDFWATKPNRVKIAGALSHWADFCSNLFFFERRPKLLNEAFEPKIESHLLLSPTPSFEVNQWAGWLPYADPNSDIAKQAQVRGGDALLAARADPSSAVEAEKLYTATIRTHLQSAFSKCREGAGDDWIAQNLYFGAGDFERTMAEVKVDFAGSVKALDAPEPKPSPRQRRSAK